MENKNENIPFPDKLVGWFDIAKGLGETALHVLTDQLRHQGISEHGTQPIKRVAFYDNYTLEEAIEEGWVHGSVAEPES